MRAPVVPVSEGVVRSAPLPVHLQLVWSRGEGKGLQRSGDEEPRVSPTRPAPGHVVFGAEMLERCLNGDPAAVRAFVDEMTPVIQARAARAVMRNRLHREERRDLAQDVEELTQEVLLTLFAEEARVLRSWDSERGMSLKNFVGLIAEREISNILQSGRRRPWTAGRALADDHAEVGITQSAELPIASRELVVRVLARLREELSPQGFSLFEMLLVEDRPVQDVCAATGLSRDAVYAWRSRLPKIVKRVAEELQT